MLLAKLLCGNEIFMDRSKSQRKADECRRLTVPPDDPKRNFNYNPATGRTGGSKVFIVYENGRAYPEYVVRFYPQTNSIP